MMIADAALIAALMRDKEFRRCLTAAQQATASAYVTEDFNFRQLSLYSGERMVIAVGKNECGWQGQAARVLVFERTPSGYRVVLNDFSLPEHVVAEPHGTLQLAAHETTNTILQSTFVWNGSSYAFSPGRSSIYCVGPERENVRPYELPIRFAPGAASTILRGTAFQNCGQNYSFVGYARQRVTIERLTPQPRDLRIPIVLDFGRDGIAYINGDVWSGTLAQSGTYRLSVFGTDQRDDVGLRAFAIRLTIH
jgi:hypothetical protein